VLTEALMDCASMVADLRAGWSCRWSFRGGLKSAHWKKKAWHASLARRACAGLYHQAPGLTASPLHSLPRHTPKEVPLVWPWLCSTDLLPRNYYVCDKYQATDLRFSTGACVVALPPRHHCKPVVKVKVKQFPSKVAVNSTINESGTGPESR
jgi:hypothetical protein